MVDHQCKKCAEYKPIDRFPKDNRLKSGHRNICKECRAKHFMLWKEKSGFIDYQKQHRKENYDKLKESSKEYKRRKRSYFNKISRERYKNDIEFRLRTNLRNRIYSAIKFNRPGSAIKDLGCSIKQLKLYLESQFQPGMTWENHGEWHIDHIKPLASFNLRIRSEFKKACHFSNLQPLWAIDNIIKSNKVD